MARFRLIGKHYLNIEGTEWEQTETDQATGQQARKRYPVPRYLDPDDPKCQNYPGEIIVTTKKDPLYPRDFYMGDVYPTLDMNPLDEEAQVMLKKVQGMGEHPIDSLPMNGQTFSDTLLEKLTRQLDDLTTRQGVPKADNDRVSALERQIEELKALITGKAQVEDQIDLPLASKPASGLSLGAK